MKYEIEQIESLATRVVNGELSKREVTRGPLFLSLLTCDAELGSWLVCGPCSDELTAQLEGGAEIE